MTVTSKSTSTDFKMAYDDSANAVDRAFAIRSLVFDRIYEIEPLLVQLLKHKEEFLRGEAINALIGRWHKAQYLGAALGMLHSDTSYVARRDSAFALGEFAAFADEADKYKKQIIQSLVHALVADDNWSVQQRCYEQLLNLICGKMFASEEFPQKNQEFDIKRDVDWKMLQSYLEKYNLEKPK